MTTDNKSPREGEDADVLQVLYHFDNDKLGHVAVQRLQETFEQRGIQVVQQYPPAGCKDVNDYLVGMNMLQTEREKRQEAGL